MNKTFISTKYKPRRDTIHPSGAVSIFKIKVLPFSNMRFSTHLMFTGGKTPDLNARGYSQIMKEQILKGEENEVSDKVNFLRNQKFYPP